MSDKNTNRPKPVDLAYSYTRVADQQGKNDDLPIILIHGLTVNKEAWMGFHEELALKTSKNICLLDVRNHGESPWSDVYDVEAMTEDVIHLMNKLEISKAIILGLSLGGKIAVHLALNYPTRIEKIIVGDMRPNGLSVEAVKDLRTFFKLYEEVDKAIAQGISVKEAKDLIRSRAKDCQTRMFQSEKKMFDFVPFKSSEGKCQWNFNPMLIPIVLNNVMDMFNESTGRFDGPSLFIYGSESSFEVNEDENNIKKLFPNATICGVKDADHAILMFPEFWDIVVKFIKGD